MGYGSRKPNSESYLLSNLFILKYRDTWELVDKNVKEFDLKKNIKKLSARYREWEDFEYKENIKEKLNKIQIKKKKTIKIIDQKKPKIENYGQIKNMEMLDNIINNSFDNIDVSDYRFKEIHDYTMILPISYWGHGSYQKWIKVGWALANTNGKSNKKDIMFLSWLKMSTQDGCRHTLADSKGNFDWDKVPELFEMWNNFEFDNSGLTYRSIMYWCKTEVRSKYEAIRNKTVDYFIYQTVKTTTEFDLALVLYYMFKMDFVCVSIKSNIWYEYVNHRWCEEDSGNKLRLYISQKMHAAYVTEIINLQNKLQNLEQNDPIYELTNKQIKKLSEIAMILKKTNWKNNIMKEAKELFYDKDFMNKLDSNPYLLCFKNCVVDFKNKISRKGQQDDYISKCTNIDYIKYDYLKNKNIIDDIKKFFTELFPNEYLKDYMWEHLASALVGTNDNQTFNIYTGSGRDGKSKLVDLMSKALGEYKGTVPITLITQKRNTIGSTSSEIVQLMGTRYAVMQDPSKGDKINEGIMKEITGGDPIQGRALFKDTVTFIPQFKLVVCTNTLFDVESNDDGT